VNAKTHATPAEVAAQAEVVIVMVADAPDVEKVCLGAEGLAAGGGKAGLVVVDMSTINPNAARSIGLRLAEKGIEFVDAPVSGGETGAINAALTIMVGGKRRPSRRSSRCWKRWASR
jgi:3-hydroxyisobutyrate dehydrogenase-like beta-hydroxyacid dehydrogenase